jgi:pseudoazurin|tara:strand:- start:44 stop:487 length:444 start_codon:yes stop_codon:yes gene_type:complete
MKNFSNNILIATIFFLVGSISSAIAADETIEMLNKQGKESMVYSKKIVRIKSGDTVNWIATTKGHNVEFIKGGVPEGVEKFKSKFNEDVQYKFTTPGIYAYWCTPHKSMGMIGFVIVDDNKTNLDQIKKIRFSGKSKKIAAELINTF